MKCKDCKHKDECADDAFINGAEFALDFEHECAGFEPFTNADHFREAISTEDGLAKFLMRVHDEGVYIPFCENKEECWDLIEENGVPDEKCMECMMQWLRKPYEGD
jgi:hypothetical protein